MRLRKRILAVTLASVMAFAFAGCGNDAAQTTAAETENETQAEETQNAEGTESEETDTETKDPVTLVWWYRGNGEQKDTKMVQDALNEKLKTYPGLEHVTVELKCYTSSEYKQAVTLAQSSKEQIDILNTVNLDFGGGSGEGKFDSHG